MGCGIIGANEDALINAEEPLEGVSNYFVGSRFINGVRHYAGVRVHGIRPGVDIVYHASKHDLEYDFVVHPGANPASLRLRFEGRRPQLDESGNISVKTTTGELKQQKPRVWQQTKDQLHEIDCRYELSNNGEVRLVLADYNPAQQLVIDPIISYSTYLGGSNVDTPAGIAVDSSGSAYILGTTQSANSSQSTSGTFHGPYTNIFVTKFNPAGTALVYSTFVNGSVNAASEGLAIAVDTNGNAYLTGLTLAADFPFTSGRLRRESLLPLSSSLDPTGNIVPMQLLSRGAGGTVEMLLL